MLSGARTQTHLQAIYEPRKLARGVLIGVLLVWGMFTLWVLQFSATAIVRQAPSPSDENLVNAVDAARSALTDERLAAIIRQLHLYQETVRPYGASSAISYMRSRLDLQSVGENENDTGMVRITYLSAEKATAIKVANALAQSLIAVTQRATDSLSADAAATVDRKLEENAFTLKQLAADRQQRREMITVTHKSSSQRSPARQDKGKLSAPGQPARPTDQSPVLLSTAPVSAPSPEESAIKALQQQIEDAGARLRELQQRYTDQYPDVQDTQEQIRELRLKLSRHQAESARSVQVALPPREEQTLRGLTIARKQLTPATVNPETKSEKSPKPLAAEQSFASQLERYQFLLPQRSKQNYRDKAANNSQPLFTLVQPATQAKAAGLAVNPRYWLFSLLAGLLASTLEVLFAYRLRRPSQKGFSLRHQFELDRLASRYRAGNR